MLDQGTINITQFHICPLFSTLIFEIICLITVLSFFVVLFAAAVSFPSISLLVSDLAVVILFKNSMILFLFSSRHNDE